MNNKKQADLEEIISNPALNEELKKLVLERVNVMPDTLNIAIGSEKMTREALKKHVEKGDEIGIQIMETELEFLRALASGTIYGKE